MPALGPPGALSPRDWNALVDYDAWRDLFSPDDGVALHHGGGSDYAAGRTPYSRAREIQQLQQWEGYHIYSKGWRGLAYGWAVGQTGTIYRIRGWATYGAHTGDMDGDGISNNDEIVPIIFVGSGNHHDLSPAAQASIESLRRFIEEGSPRAKRLYGHQELRGTVTSCPGPKGMAYVNAHRELTPPEEAPVSLPVNAQSHKEEIRHVQEMLGVVATGTWDFVGDVKALAVRSGTGDPNGKNGVHINGRMYTQLLSEFIGRHGGSGVSEGRVKEIVSAARIVAG